MKAEWENLLRLADRDLAAGRWEDAEREYARALELDPDLYTALYGRSLARGWRRTPLEGGLAALTADVEEAFQLCRRTGGSERELRARVAVDLINLTSAKFNELTGVWASIAAKDNQKAPSPLFYQTWSPWRPQGLTLSDVYLPVINYLASIILIGEYLDGILTGRVELLRRRLRNAENLERFYDWLAALHATGCVGEAYYNEILDKKRQIGPLRVRLERECAAQTKESTPADEQPQSEPEPEPEPQPQSEPEPGVAVKTDEEKKLAHFAARPPRELICPVCGTVQSSNRSICAQCSCKFFFDNEI